MRLALKVCAAWPFTLIDQGNRASSGQSGVHSPFGPRESPPPDRPTSDTRVRTGVTTGICSVNTAGTTLWSRSVARWITPGTSTLATRSPLPLLFHRLLWRWLGQIRVEGR